MCVFVCVRERIFFFLGGGGLFLCFYFDLIGLYSMVYKGTRLSRAFCCFCFVYLFVLCALSLVADLQGPFRRVWCCGVHVF